MQKSNEKWRRIILFNSNVQIAELNTVSDFQTASRAWVRSRIISFSSSMPTESLTKLSLIPSFSRWSAGTEACVMITLQITVCFDVFWCVLICFWCVLMYFDVFWCKCIDVFWCVVMCFDVFWCVLMCVMMCFDVFWCVLMCFWCVLMCFDMFWCVLMCFDVFWCI